MREIKFRAWDVENKEWYQNYYGLMIDGESGGVMRNEVCMEENQIDIMQYTGLKDKNGKEIYEGDIRCGKYYFETDEQTRYQVMEWDPINTCFYWNGPEMPEFIDTEVIGNIYENPELLK